MGVSARGVSARGVCQGMVSAWGCLPRKLYENEENWTGGASKILLCKSATGK